MAPARHTAPPAHARRARAVLAMIAASLSLAVAAPAVAAPGPAVAPRLAGALLAEPGTDDEGGTAKLREQLDAASRGFLDAQARLDASTKRQKELVARLGTLEGELATRTRTVGELADTAYRTGRLGPVTALLNAGTPDGLMDRAARLEAVAANEDKHLRALLETRDAQTEAKAAVDREIVEQRTQVAAMAKRKQQAERALEVAGNQARSTGGASGGGGTSSASAKPAPRNADGSWPSESCSVEDPTTSGCITPRTLHALNQAKAAGYTRYVSCYRSGGSGEHPKGRACDFAAQKGGFGGVATGGDRTYGNNLAAYYVKNASRLGVLYVIWFKEIWLPSSGWKSYSGAGGDPSSDHTNHVHLSVN